ncbi:MAG: hypothetical protein KQH63_05825 [Desulfobulbaceae bacterium]|nr:hypothetical protein [Desulfobulbaceae bacterium]
MTKISALKIINPILAVLLISQVLTALLHDLLPKEAYEVLHGGGGIAFSAVATLHVILNWNWVKANFLNKKSTQKR